MNRFKNIALLVCCIAVLAYVSPKITGKYHYTNKNYIFQIGGITMIISWVFSIVIGFANALFIFYEKQFNQENKIVWIVISLLPILGLLLILFWPPELFK